MASRNPSTWDEYEGRQQSPGRTDSVSSFGRGSVRFDETESLLGRSPMDNHEGQDGEWTHRLRRRRQVLPLILALEHIC